MTRSMLEMHAEERYYRGIFEQTLGKPTLQGRPHFNTDRQTDWKIQQRQVDGQNRDTLKIDTQIDSLEVDTQIHGQIDGVWGHNDGNDEEDSLINTDF